jgi:hypothetical protein
VVLPEDLRTQLNADDKSREDLRTQRNTDDKSREDLRTQRNTDDKSREDLRTQRNTDDKSREDLRTQRNTDGESRERTNGAGYKYFQNVLIFECAYKIHCTYKSIFPSLSSCAFFYDLLWQKLAQKIRLRFTIPHEEKDS